MPNTSAIAPLGDIVPDRESFRELARHRRVIPVTTRLLADTVTPVGLYSTLGDNKPGTFLLESAQHGRSWSRWSFVGAASNSVLTESDGQAHWLGKTPAGLPTSGDPLTVLTESLRLLHTEPLAGMPPLTGGLVGYLGYDIVHRLYNLTQGPNGGAKDELGLPELVMLVATDLAALDHHEGTVTLIANAINWDGSDERVDAAYDDAVARLQSMTAALANPSPQSAAVYDEVQPEPVRRTSAADYEVAVEKAQGYIANGEATQIVVSQRFDMDIADDRDESTTALRTYRVLRATNPSPYMYLLNLPTAGGAPVRIVGSSPEALVTVRDGVASMHPIAGTRPRGETPEDDILLEKELLADEKECSEHDMLVDLGKHDLGKVCVPETISVPEYFVVERFSHVMHIVSTVRGELAPDRTAMDAVTACFPAGTLSGAPKRRALEIIDELEPARRGPYGGLVGYLDFAGDADVAIAIRTAILHNRVAHVQAGAGVVAQSIPSHEDAECRNKAAAVLRALGAASTWRDVNAAP